MPWVNVARLLTILRRRGEDPRDHTVYWDDEGTDFRRPRSRYTERSGEPTDDESEYDDGDED